MCGKQIIYAKLNPRHIFQCRLSFSAPALHRNSNASNYPITIHPSALLYQKSAISPSPIDWFLLFPECVQIWYLSFRIALTQQFCVERSKSSATPETIPRTVPKTSVAKKLEIFRPESHCSIANGLVENLLNELESVYSVIFTITGNLCLCH